jgi:uncharacterized Zn-finger protein
MKQHRERMHLGVKYPCNGCSYQATDKSHLRRHKQRVHHGLKYSCEQCGQFYSDMSTLKRHIRNLHTTEKKVFVCDACDFRALEAGFPVLMRFLLILRDKFPPKKNLFAWNCLV